MVSCFPYIFVINMNHASFLTNAAVNLKENGLMELTEGDF